MTQEQWAQQHPDLPESAYPKESPGQRRQASQWPNGHRRTALRERLAKFEDWVLRTDDILISTLSNQASAFSASYGHSPRREVGRGAGGEGQ